MPEERRKLEHSDFGFAEVLDKWQNQEKVWNFETSTENLQKVFSVLGYDSLGEFFADNPGAQEAVIEWISEVGEKNDQWKASIFEELSDETLKEMGDDLLEDDEGDRDFEMEGRFDRDREDFQSDNITASDWPEPNFPDY